MIQRYHRCSASWEGYELTDNNLLLRKENAMSKAMRLYNPSSLPVLFDEDVFGPVDVLLDRFMSKHFKDFHDVFGPSPFESTAYPKVDVRETQGEFIIEAEIPGLRKDQVKVEVKDDALIIRGEKREENKKDGTYHVKEIKRSSFIRSWILPKGLVDKDSVKAKFIDGLLEVSVKKTIPEPPPKPEVKQIAIE